MITASDGNIVRNGLEMILKKETDGYRRVIQKRILDEAETKHFGLVEK